MLMHFTGCYWTKDNISWPLAVFVFVVLSIIFLTVFWWYWGPLVLLSYSLRVWLKNGSLFNSKACLHAGSNRLTESVRKVWHNGRQRYLCFLWLQSPSDYLTFHKDGKESKDTQINRILGSVTLKNYHLIQCGDHKASNWAASYCGCLTIVPTHPLLPSFTLSCCETQKKPDEWNCA